MSITYDWGKPYLPELYIGDSLPTFNRIDSYKEENCVLCLDKKSNVMFCNCGHICICEKCNEGYRTAICLLCKTYNDIRRKV